MAPIVGYWDFRGIAEPIRLILHHLGVEFEDKRYPYGTQGIHNFDAWLNEKETLGLEFPNIPYYIDGDFKMTQTVSIVRYLAKKHGLMPETEEDEVRASILEQMSKDILMDVLRHAYYPAPETPERQLFLSRRALYPVKRLSESLGEKRWFVNDQLSYVDFLLAEALDQLAYIYPHIFKEYPNIMALIKRVESLPNVQKYIQSEKYKAWPLYMPYARFGGTGQAPERNT